jgi:hypothetical protein
MVGDEVAEGYRFLITFVVADSFGSETATDAKPRTVSANGWTDILVRTSADLENEK